MKVKTRIDKLLKALNKGVYEKEEVMALSLLTAIAGDSIFLLGAPGVAKSLIARRLKYAFKDAQSFEYLMNRFSTPDEIFGPVSISKLKDEDKYERVVDNYLPTATVVFLDEIWKAGPSIQNALLTVINEKIYRNGDKEIKVPMKALISASNELPMKGEGLEALWDRFIVRYEVEAISEMSSFNEMISNSSNLGMDHFDAKLGVSDDEYTQWSKAIDAIGIPENIFNVIHVIRNYIREYNEKKDNQQVPIYVSDRRWKKIVRLMRASAFLNDRKEVDLMDCFLISHCVWNEQNQIALTSQFTNDAIEKHGYSVSIDLSALKEELEDLKKDVKSETSYTKSVPVKKPVAVYDKFYRIANINTKTYGQYENFKLILIKDFKNLGASYKEVQVFNDSDSERSRTRYYHCDLKLGSNGISVVIDSTAYKLESESKTKRKNFTKSPHSAVTKEWGKRVQMFLTTSSNTKAQIDHYRNTDLKHVRTNLFVNPSKADLVEQNLYKTERDIEKLEVDIKGLEHGYRNIKADTEEKSPKYLS